GQLRLGRRHAEARNELAIRPSGRVPRDFSPNPLHALLLEKRRSGVRVLDATVTNPTRVGLPAPDARALAVLSDPRAAAYDPDPRGWITAREAVAATYGSVDPDRIVLTSSTSEAYAHLFRLLCGPSDEVLVPRPSYPLFEPLAQLESVTLCPYRLAYGPRWTLDFDSLEAALSPRTRAVVVVEPNNPTGSCLTLEERERLESLCAERRLAIISDEVFSDAPWPPRREPLPSWCGRRRVLTFVLGGISKLCGLPQMKLGWIVVAGPDDEARGALEGLEWISDLFLSVGAPVQLALHRFLAERGPFRHAMAARLDANLRALASAARRPSAPFSLLAGDGGWSAVLRFAPPVGGAPGRNPAEWALETCDVLLHPGEFYQLPLEEDCVVSLLTEPSVLAEALDRIGDGWARNPRVD
ncbi:MAG: pyridoxal phosphate-dependent aminotransferase, partial [Candidatus Eiseniibacteriota bacterium]